eukprot:Seg6319.2 transcript_id=Seg6319.2/GoldUCD/mRNA.D3Y31 product="N-lysine methyltransferase KMT5A" protein_id=Seg6319.2/GoldUCD/D3Y31
MASLESPPRCKIKKPNSARSPSTLHTYFKEASNNRNAIVQDQEIVSHRNTVIDDDLAILEDKSTKVPAATSVKNVKTTPRKKKRGDKSVGKPLKEKRKPRKADSEETDSLKQSTITSHFQVRRSNRRCKSTLQMEKDKLIMERLLDEDESGLEVRVLPDKGRGIFAAREMKRGDLVCEYAGELIDYDLGKERELLYSHNPELGCYSYFFQYKNKKYCVDATKETTRLGRLLNHSKTDCNVCTRIFPIKDVPRLILIASRDIKVGEELLYDYGDRSKVAVESYPWLKS